MEEEEQILKSVPTEGECPVGLLTQWEMELKALEDWLDSPEPEGGFHKIAMPEETHQHELQLEEAGMEPVEELTGVNLSEVIAEQKPSDEKSAGVEAAAEWKAKATRDEEDNLGDQCDLPIDKEEVQQASLQKESQPMEQLDEVVEEIRKLMLGSAEEAVSKEKLDKKETCTSSGDDAGAASNEAEEQRDNSKRKFGIQEDFNQAGKLMSRSS
jgi:hypothetical protein